MGHSPRRCPGAALRDLEAEAPACLGWIPEPPETEITDLWCCHTLGQQATVLSSALSSVVQGPGKAGGAWGLDRMGVCPAFQVQLPGSCSGKLLEKK